MHDRDASGAHEEPEGTPAKRQRIPSPPTTFGSAEGNARKPAEFDAHGAGASQPSAPRQAVLCTDDSASELADAEAPDTWVANAIAAAFSRLSPFQFLSLRQDNLVLVDLEDLVKNDTWSHCVNRFERCVAAQCRQELGIADADISRPSSRHCAATVAAPTSQKLPIGLCSHPKTGVARKPTVECPLRSLEIAKLPENRRCLMSPSPSEDALHGATTAVACLMYKLTERSRESMEEFIVLTARLAENQRRYIVARQVMHDVLTNGLTPSDEQRRDEIVRVIETQMEKTLSSKAAIHGGMRELGQRGLPPRGQRSGSTGGVAQPDDSARCLQSGPAQERRQARDGKWYTKQEFFTFYSQSTLGGLHYWEEAGRKTGELGPASSDATAGPAAELAAALAGPGASHPVPFSVDGTVVLTAVQHQGRQAVEEAGRPSLDLFDDTPGAAAEPAAALVPPGASQPEVGPAGGTVAPTVSQLLKGQAVAEARELKLVSSDGTPGAAASLAAPGASQIGPLLSDGGAVSVSTGGAAERADPDVRLRPCPPKMPPPAYLLARQSS